MKQWLVVAMVVLATGCFGTVNEPQGAGKTYTVRIDWNWSTEQQDAIRLGVAYWQTLLEPHGHTIQVVVDRCKVWQFGCMTSVDPTDPSLVLKGEVMAGVERMGAIVMSNDLRGDDLALCAAHELGHRLGLRHTEEGTIMFEAIWGAGWALSETSEESLEARGLL